MDIRFIPATLADIRDSIQQHLMSLPSAIDSYLEDHITESAHYQIYVGDDIAGFTSIHKGSLITQFALATSFKQAGQSIYSRIKKLENAQAALVPTCDEFFLSHALDEYRQLTKQAYFFAARTDNVEEVVPSPFTLRRAELADIPSIQEGSGEFFGDAERIKRSINKGELFLMFGPEGCVGFGIMDRSELCGSIASIGMYVIESFRQQGVGTATLRLLQNECLREGLRPVAGCWYYNHLSKKTLESAGMFTQTRLLRIEY